MKQPENNEIDILLRGLASRERAAPTELAGAVTGAHLDADELNSYAEGVLPPSTRARYSAHLADCDDCRQIVTQLSLAAGPRINETPISRASATFAWRTMVASLFAPSVLRYAMPALVLIVVGVAFFAWRQQQRREFVALNNKQQEVSTAIQPDGAVSKEQSGAFAETRNGATPVVTHGQSPANKAGEKAEKTTDTAKPASESNTEKEPAKNEVAVAQPAYAPEPAPPPAAAKPATTSETKDNAQVASALDDLKPAAARKREADKQGEKTRADASASASGAAAADAPAAGKDDDRKKEKALSIASRRAVGRDEESETRTVGGRRFQRRNNIWVDAAYSDSLSMTTVTRGSEQYRALVADEPGIDAIAKQLSGEVKVVWKGRAYHIR